MRVKREYPSISELKKQLKEHDSKGVMLLPETEIPAGLQQFDTVEFTFCAENQTYQVHAEIIQIIKGMGLVIKVADLENILQLMNNDPNDEQVESTPLSSEPVLPGSHSEARAMAFLGWPIEKLRTHWDELNIADRLRLAKQGKRPARGLILRGTDRKLHSHLLLNPKITADEIAVLARSSKDPTLLRRIASNKEWLQNTDVVRNLICSPTMPLVDARKLLRYLSSDEMRRLTRTGRVRAALKREIIKYLDQTGW
ncbi:MAG: hypothetical protein V1754_00655 [Pseudomonadota bacterium]